MVTLNVNGKAHQVDVPPDTLLLWVLRDALGLTGTKYGCGMALCGACTVHVDGQPARACVTPVSAAAQKKVTTIEAIGADRVGKAVQTAVPSRETLRLKDPSRFRYIGKGNLKLVDGPDIVSGKAQYGIDIRLPGMLYAVVARPPVYGGKVAKYDAEPALKVPGVLRVVEIERSPAPAEFTRSISRRRRPSASIGAWQHHWRDAPGRPRRSSLPPGRC
jgi:ferredoxin